MFIISRGAGPSSGGMNNLVITEPNLILFCIAVIITMLLLTQERSFSSVCWSIGKQMWKECTGYWKRKQGIMI